MNKKLRGWLQIFVGALIAGLQATLAYRDSISEQKHFSLALLILLALAAVTAIAAGLSTLAEASRQAQGEPEQRYDYRHTYQLFILLGGGLLALMVARSLAVPDSFEKYGFYRGDAAIEARTVRTPRLQGKTVCAECHDELTPLHEKDVHRTVQCEDCHGPADRHVREQKDKTQDFDPAASIVRPKENDICLICHRALNARPGSFPQVEWREHFKAGGVKPDKIETTKCINCHNPHEPLFLTKPLPEARLHPLIHRCRDCHVGLAKDAKMPPQHPATFSCQYCHDDLDADFQKRKHADVTCTTCHLFQRDSDFAGRIIRNTDPRFCLLCHGKTDFRDANGKVKLVKWPQHLTDHDKKLTDKKTPCVNCHADEIHGDTKKFKAAAKEKK